MAKQTWVNVNGAWKKVKSAWVNINGIWKKDVMPKGVVNGDWKEFMSYLLPDLDMGKGITRRFILGNSNYSSNFKRTAIQLDDGHLVLTSDSSYPLNDRRAVIDSEGVMTGYYTSSLVDGSFNGKFIYGKTNNRGEICKATKSGSIISRYKAFSNRTISSVFEARGKLYVISIDGSSSVVSEFTTNYEYVRDVKRLSYQGLADYKLVYDRVNDVFYEIIRPKIYCKSDLENDITVWESDISGLSNLYENHIFFDYPNRGIIVSYGEDIVSGPTPPYAKYYDRNGKAYNMVGATAGTADNHSLWTKDSLKNRMRLRLYKFNNRSLIKTIFFSEAEKKEFFGGGMGSLPITSKRKLNFLIRDGGLYIGDIDRR